MNSDSSHQAAVAAVQSFNRRSHHGQVEDHQHHVNVNAACHTGNTIASKKFSSTGPMGMPGGAHDMNKFYMSSLLNLNQTQTTSKENASASNHQGKYFCLFCLDHYGFTLNSLRTKAQLQFSNKTIEIACVCIKSCGMQMIQGGCNNYCIKCNL